MTADSAVPPTTDRERAIAAEIVDFLRQLSHDPEARHSGRNSDTIRRAANAVEAEFVFGEGANHDH